MSPGTAEGELVTRSDGSQAMRVKKRRRRSNQAVDKETKRNQRLQIIQIAGFAILLILLGLVAGVGLIYANSSSFQKGLISKAAVASGGELELKQYRINPATANATSARFDWPAGNILSSLELNSLVAKINPASFLGKAFTGDEIVGVNGDLILQSSDHG